MTRAPRPRWGSPSRKDYSPAGSFPSENISRATGTHPPPPTTNCPSSGPGGGEGGVRAVAAGCDVVLVCRGESAQAEAIDRLARETRDRPTFRRTLAAAAVRSGRLRDWAASKERCRPAPRAVGAARHRRLSSLLREVWESTGRTSPADISGNIGEG